jgi:ureidoglycolate lyase
MKLKVHPLTAEAFAPFGQVVSLPSGKPTAVVDGGGLTYWADVITVPDLSGALGVGYCTVVSRPFIQTCAERHMHTPEFVQPMKGDMIVVVAPALHPESPRQLPPLREFVAFRVAEGQALVFNPGVWHYAPFAVDRPMCFTVLFKAGTSDDDAVVVDFPAGEALEIEV